MFEGMLLWAKGGLSGPMTWYPEGHILCSYISQPLKTTNLNQKWARYLRCFLITKAKSLVIKDLQGSPMEKFAMEKI